MFTVDTDGDAVERVLYEAAKGYLVPRTVVIWFVIKMSGFTPSTASISGVRAMQYHDLNGPGRINNENWQF